jgi:hypothetical protein
MLGLAMASMLARLMVVIRPLEAFQAETLLSLDSPFLIYLVASLYPLLELALLVLVMHTPFILEHLMCSQKSGRRF